MERLSGAKNKVKEEQKKFSNNWISLFLLIRK